MGSFDPMEVGGRKNELLRPVHRLDEPAGISLGMVASPQCPLPFRPQNHCNSATSCRFSTSGAHDSAGTQTGQTRILA